MSLGKPVYNFTVGTPDFQPDTHVMEAVSKAALDPENYKYSLGDSPELIDAVINWYQRRYQVKLNEDEIVITLTDSFNHRNSETGIVSLGQISAIDEPTLVPANNPSLILYGGRIIELNQSVINIGRKASNHIIISDPRVSRVHAQLRRIKEEYMVFDVDSAGGTFINSERIQSHVLRPGDVISLAGYTMIFTTDQHPSGETRKGITAELKSTNEEEE